MTRVIDAHDVGDDALVVRGYVDGVLDADGRERLVVARGWLSAMAHHYDDAAYGPDGHLLPEAVARAMTPEERVAYGARLLEQAAGVVAATPVDLGLGV